SFGAGKPEGDGTWRDLPWRKRCRACRDDENRLAGAGRFHHCHRSLRLLLQARQAVSARTKQTGGGQLSRSSSVSRTSSWAIRTTLSLSACDPVPLARCLE